ncbi:uncharacterized protein BJ212DRAFT_1304762 [Suillus subaureus]|uniref:Uncharacterized protein n=1 Tax=Suillus subaureus TaxID=48587 RepID=A0A9P7DTT1_9AGAM|nr:uncharacterized protein BJ212DRAFT_1304762 [Suillus subaureus]KAG1802979.1 hypothetical protein BJ212DRAFT_1304762 [Suillus subaureus]
MLILLQQQWLKCMKMKLTLMKIIILYMGRWRNRLSTSCWGRGAGWVTPSVIALWDYAQEIIQDNVEYTQSHPHMPHPAHPPIQILCCDRCLLALMVEDRHKVVIWLWQELNEIEHLLGSEHI